MLGEKINRRIHTLGNKIKRQSKILGNKANIALKSTDIGLRKAQNFTQNKLLPIASLVNPELGAAAATGLGGIIGARKLVHQGQSNIRDLEKMNVRKKLDEMAANAVNHNSSSSFV